MVRPGQTKGLSMFVSCLFCVSSFTFPKRKSKIHSCNVSQ